MCHLFSLGNPTDSLSDSWTFGDLSLETPIAMTFLEVSKAMYETVPGINLEVLGGGECI